MSIIHSFGKRSGMGAVSDSRKKFNEKISKLSIPEMESLYKEIRKAQIKANSIDFLKLSKGDKIKAKSMFKKVLIKGLIKAYKKFGIDYKASDFEKQKVWWKL